MDPLSIKTEVILGFPGIGKSFLLNKHKDLVLEIDIGITAPIKIGKNCFPERYLQMVKENIGKKQIILLSVYKDVRKALYESNIDFTLVYPIKELKDEYIQRYEKRGSSTKFINYVSDNWGELISELESEKNCNHIQLKEGQFLLDYFNVET
jgi:hypothetical protein